MFKSPTANHETNDRIAEDVLGENEAKTNTEAESEGKLEQLVSLRHQDELPEPLSIEER